MTCCCDFIRGSTTCRSSDCTNRILMDDICNIAAFSLCVSDIDECSQSPEICTFGTCSNTEGSFTCLCPEGFVISASGRRCLGNCVCACVCVCERERKRGYTSMVKSHFQFVPLYLVFRVLPCPSKQSYKG